MLDTKQFAKKANALYSSTVNVVCAKVTTTTTTTKDMWNRMNNVTERRRSIDSFDRAFPENIQDNSSQDEEEDDDDEDDQESELDIMGESDQEDQKRTPNLFEFHFEFGSKRPPTTTFIPSEDEQTSDQDEEQSVDDDWVIEGKSRYSPSLLSVLLGLTLSLSLVLFF